VALARAVVIEPEVLLLDEPLGALDAKLREELQFEIKRVQAALNMTTLFVTHDQGEALSMSDRIAVMKDGRIVQTAAPVELYENPNCRFVANFLGKANLLEVVVEEVGSDNITVRGRGATQDRFQLGRWAGNGFVPGQQCLLTLRPEHLHIGTERANRITGLVRGLSYLGNFWQVDIEAADGARFVCFLKPGEAVPKLAERVDASWSPDRGFLLPTAETPQPES